MTVSQAYVKLLELLCKSNITRQGVLLYYNHNGYCMVVGTIYSKRKQAYLTLTYVYNISWRELKCKLLGGKDVHAVKPLTWCLQLLHTPNYTN